MDPPGIVSRAGATVAARTLSGHGISDGLETYPSPDSTRTRFLISRLVAQLLIFVILDRARPRSEELVRYASGARSLAAHPEGPAKPALAHLSPVARAYPSLRFQRIFQAVVRWTVLSKNEPERGDGWAACHVFDMHNLFTGSWKVNNW